MPAETKKQKVALKDCEAELFGGPATVRAKYANEKEASEEEATAFMKTHEVAIATTGDAAPPPCTALPHSHGILPKAQKLAWFLSTLSY